MSDRVARDGDHDAAGYLRSSNAGRCDVRVCWKVRNAIQRERIAMSSDGRPIAMATITSEPRVSVAIVIIEVMVRTDS